MMHLIILNCWFSFMFMSLNHPLSLGFILLLQTSLTTLISGLLYYNFWFSYILFLIMISSLLVMFIYMTSIASNESFTLPKSKIWMSICFIIVALSLFIDNYYNSLVIFNISQNQNLFNQNYSLYKFFYLPKIKLMMAIMIYLLLTLIVVVKITGKYNSPLRQK
uniref:NADH-ubiquinone oxidoreductase chain 6 n=1 Tax=Curculionoidea sp. 1 KM-2017 TaxID=2219392 RepID=A0A346RI11_9CUCU|nr:NADH dehydrogenase subunit 6 [Curculionoidea sp. 1 KM-2017]